MDDHLRINDHFDLYQEELTRSREKALTHFENFAKLLERHIRCEEKILFPALEKKDDRKLNEQIAYLLDEHVEIRQAIVNLRQKLGSGTRDVDHEEKEIIYRLGEHNAREEYHVYPRLEELLSPEENKDAMKALHTEKKTP